MYSSRFEMELHLTKHAQQRMDQRDIDQLVLLDLIELGDLRYKDQSKGWIAKDFRSRTDNLICAAIATEDKLVIKTVMHHFSWGID